MLDLSSSRSGFSKAVIGGADGEWLVGCFLCGAHAGRQVRGHRDTPTLLHPPTPRATTYKRFQITVTEIRILTIGFGRDIQTFDSL